MSITNLLHWSYYFDSNMASTFSGFWVGVIITALIILASAILSVKAGKFNHYKKLIAVRITRMGFIIGWAGLIWLFMRYQTIPYFSWRLWPALLFIYLVIELWYLYRFIKIDYPKKMKDKGKSKEKDIYLRRFLGK